MEGATDRAIIMSAAKPGGGGASGGCYGGVISGNIITARLGTQGVMSLISGGGVTIHGNIFAGNVATGYILNVLTGDGISDVSWFSNSYDTALFANRDAADSWQFDKGTLASTPFSGNNTHAAIQVRQNTTVTKTIQDNGVIV